MIDTAVILAAGKGTRMRELGLSQPKHIILVKERPFLFYLLDNLAKAGFSKLVIVAGYKKEVMMERLKDWHKLPVEIVVQADWVPQNQYGTACPIKAVEHLLTKQSFIAVNGDNLYSVRDLQVFRKLDNWHAVAGLWHKHPERYGALVLQASGLSPHLPEYPAVSAAVMNDGFNPSRLVQYPVERCGDLLAKIVEKPKEFVSNFVNIGLYAFTPEVFEVLPQVKLSPRGEYEITDAVNLLAAKNRVKVIKLTDYWLDFTKPEDIKTVEDFVISGKL